MNTNNMNNNSRIPKSFCNSIYKNTLISLKTNVKYEDIIFYIDQTKKCDHLYSLSHLRRLYKEELGENSYKRLTDLQQKVIIEDKIKLVKTVETYGYWTTNQFKFASKK